MQGLWNVQMTFPELEENRFPLASNIDQDKLLLTDGKNCHRFEQLEEDVSKSPEWSELFNEKLPNEYLNENLYDWLRDETDTHDFDLLQMSDVATYVHIATWHGMKLEFPVSEEHFKWCQVSSDEFVYEWLAASPEFWQLGVNKILSLLDEAFDVVFER